jgi:predicted DNA-binding transcriptional regulator AlpA
MKPSIPSAVAAPASSFAANDLWLRTEAAARHLGVSRRWLEELRVAGGGPAYARLGRRAIVYRRSELDRWALARLATSTSDSTAATEQ